MATNKLVGRGTAGTGVMEEITLGTNLSLSGNTLNAASTQAYNRIQEEGSNLTQRSIINFIGTGVTATDNAGTSATDVTINYGNDFVHAEKNLFATTSSYSPLASTIRSVISGYSIAEWSTKTESGVTSFNTGTGVFTAAVAGWYTLNMRLVTRINATSVNDDTNGSGSHWMSPAGSNGFVAIGLVLTTVGGNTQMIASNKQLVTQNISDINIDTTCGSYYLSVGDSVATKLLNYTDYPITGFASSASLPDCIFQFTAIKIK
jgi:hypothetical protein